MGPAIVRDIKSYVSVVSLHTIDTWSPETHAERDSMCHYTYLTWFYFSASFRLFGIGEKPVKPNAATERIPPKFVPWIFPMDFLTISLGSELAMVTTTPMGINHYSTNYVKILPIGSMYGIYGSTFTINKTPFMLAYIPYMDPMGNIIFSYMHVHPWNIAVSSSLSHEIIECYRHECSILMPSWLTIPFISVNIPINIHYSGQITLFTFVNDV